MKKTVPFLLALVLLVSLFGGCAPKTEEPSNPDIALEQPTPTPEEIPAPVQKDSFSIATLKGPTTMGLVKLLADAEEGLLNYDISSELYGTPDEITALIIGGQVDMAAVPCNLASVLYNKTNGAIQVVAINTLGVLNVLELGEEINSIADLKGKTIYSTGKGATPEYVLNAVLLANGIDPATDVTIEFKSESTEIAALLTGDSAVPGSIAVLPQPYATTVLVKNPDARIALDLTEEWVDAEIDGNLITGVFVARRSFSTMKADLINNFLADYAKSAAWVNANNTEASEMIAALEIVADAKIAEKALPHCAIVAIAGEDMKGNVAAYLKALFEQSPASVGGALPGNDFYFGA